MSEDQFSPLHQATDFVNGGNYEQALEMSRSILVTDPNNADAKLIEAISLSALGSPRDASEAFSAAIQLAPTIAKPRFNAAVHEFNVGNIGPARLLANEAKSLDPQHDGVSQLLERMGPEPQFSSKPSYPRIASNEFETPNEGIEFIRKNPHAWMLIGWCITLGSFLTTIWFLMTIVPHFNELLDAGKSIGDGPAGFQKTKGLQNSIGSPLLSVAVYGFSISNLAWMVMDIIHRKGNFVWLILHIPCTCLGLGLGGNFITLPIYILFGRK